MHENPWLVVLAAWLFPGAGHFLLKRWASGAMIAGTVILMTIVALRLSGAHLLDADAEKGMMYWFHQISSAGNGALYLLLWLFGGGSALEMREALKSETFEYGVRFFAAAGLLNYLAALDAADICLRRKR